MQPAETESNTHMPPSELSRRGFLQQAAGSLAGSLSIAAVAGTTGCDTRSPNAASDGDSASSQIASKATLDNASGSNKISASQPDASGGKRKSPLEFAGQTCRVFVYAGFCEQVMREFVVPKVLEETGAECILDSGWWDGMSRLRSTGESEPPFDLMITDATQGLPAIKEGLFRTLSKNALPNASAFAPAVLNNSVFEQGYGLTYADSVMLLAWQPQSCPFEPTRWSDLLDSRLHGRVGLYASFYMSLYTFGCIRAAVEQRTESAAKMVEDDLAGVLEFAREHRGIVRNWWNTSGDMLLDLAGGTCSAGNLHSPETLAAIRDGAAVRAIAPERDRAFVQIMWLIPASSRKAMLAERVMNIIASPEVQAGFARRGSACCIPAVAANIAKDDPAWASLYPHREEQFAELRYYPYTVYQNHWSDIAAFWENKVLRNG